MDDDAPLRPPIHDASVSVVLPVLGTKAIAILERWQPALEKFPTGSQLLLIDDSDVWADPTRIAPSTHFIHHPQAHGVGGCLQTGLLLADTPLILAVLDDGSFDPHECLKLLEAIDQVDIAAGCRSLGSTPTAIRIYERVRAIAARILLGYTPDARPGWSGTTGIIRRWIARRGFGVPVADPLCGIFLARTAVLRRLPIQSRGSFAWIELLAKANHLGCLLTDVPIACSRPIRLDAGFATDARRVFGEPDFGPRRESPVLVLPERS